MIVGSILYLGGDMARYKKDGLEFPSVTEIIGDCTDKSGALTMWSANQVVLWIRENCQRQLIPASKSSENTEILIKHHVFETDLNDARFHFKTVSKEALDVGSEVHDIIEKHLLLCMEHPAIYSIAGVEHPDEIKLSKGAQNAFTAFLNWAKEYDVKPIELEKRVYLDSWAGTLDFYGEFNGKKYVIDWKTSKKMYPEMRYQVAAYRHAREMMFAWDIDTPPRQIEGCGVLRLDKESGMPEWKDTSKTYFKDLSIFHHMVDLYFERHPIIAKKAGRENLPF